MMPCLGINLSHLSSWLLLHTMTGARERGVIASMRILRGRDALATVRGDRSASCPEGGGSRDVMGGRGGIPWLYRGVGGGSRGAGVRGGSGGTLKLPSWSPVLATYSSLGH